MAHSGEMQPSYQFFGNKYRLPTINIPYCHMQCAILQCVTTVCCIISCYNKQYCTTAMGGWDRVERLMGGPRDLSVSAQARQGTVVATSTKCPSPRSSFPNVFVQSAKQIFTNYKVYLSKVRNIFVRIVKCLGPDCTAGQIVMLKCPFPCSSFLPQRILKKITAQIKRKPKTFFH